MVKYYGLSSDIPHEDSERIVAEATRQLSDEWTVIHHVSWQSLRDGRQGDGEADFIFFHPQKGILIVEVKGGGVEIQQGRWTSTSRTGKIHEIKNPFEQATSSKHALIDWLREMNLSDKIGVGHIVIFPHLNEIPFIGPLANKAIAISKLDLSKLDQTLGRAISHWGLKGNLNSKETIKLIQHLMPTVSIQRKLSNQSIVVEDNILKLTAEQISLFSGLRASRGGLILGGAGTGKTVLAAARAFQLAKDGFQTLLLCFNELLGDDLSERLRDCQGSYAGTYHSLCIREIRKAKINIPNVLSKEWWEKTAPDLLIEACAINGTKFDAVVIDEAQDFSPLWLDSLSCLTASTKDAPFFIFADPKQEIWSRDWSSHQVNFDFSWELKHNLRNSDPIAEKVASIHNKITSVRNIPGPAPIWQMANDGKNIESEVISAVEKLIDEGFGPKNIIVLCASAQMASNIRERTICSFSMGKWGMRGIPVETIARFKGMESEAVVLVLDSKLSDDLLMSAYIGISRARSVLTVVGNSNQKDILSWGKA